MVVKTENVVSDATSNWSEFAGAAADIFDVWLGGSELEWAEQTWGKLSRAGLTTYDTELERTEVCIRFMTLGMIYLRFCHLAWEEDVDFSFMDWASDLDIQPFHLGRLLEAQPEEVLRDLVELCPHAD